MSTDVTLRLDGFQKTGSLVTASSSTASQLFQFEDYDVRIVTRDGEPWFVLADVCRVLEITDPSVAARRLRDSQRMTQCLALGQKVGRGGAQSYTIINESGLYRLVLRSDKPQAERFQIWVEDEVLPMIRKTGVYSRNIPMMMTPKTVTTNDTIINKVARAGCQDAKEMNTSRAKPTQHFAIVP